PVEGKPETRRFAVTSGDTTHAVGFVSAAKVSPANRVDVAPLTKRHERDAIYAAFTGAGIAYGEPCRLVDHVTTDGASSVAKLLPGRGTSFVLDAALQSFGMLVFDPSKKELYVPFSIDAVTFHCAMPNTAYVRSTRTSDVGEIVRADVVICDADGNVAVEIAG